MTGLKEIQSPSLAGLALPPPVPQDGKENAASNHESAAPDGDNSGAAPIKPDSSAPAGTLNMPCPVGCKQCH